MMNYQTNQGNNYERFYSIFGESFSKKLAKNGPMTIILNKQGSFKSF